jgi:hypothetical protein
MSQPTEGPQQPRGNWSDALDRLGAMSAEDWGKLGRIVQLEDAAFDRLIAQAQKVPLKDKLNDAVRKTTTRVHALYRQTSVRLSEGAQRLAAQGREFAEATGRAATQFGNQVVDTARTGRDAVVNAAEATGRATVNAAQATGRAVAGAAQATGEATVNAAQATGRAVAGAAQATGQAVTGAAQATGRAVTQAANATADRATEFGQQVAGAYQTGREAVAQGTRAAVDGMAAGGRAVANAGQRAVQNTTRWFQNQTQRVTLASEAARATFASVKFDRNIPQQVSPKDLSQLSQQYSAVISAPTLEARLEALQGIVADTQQKMDMQTAARALGGVAPAGQLVGQAQTQGQGQQPSEQVNVAQQQNKKPDKGLGGR